MEVALVTLAGHLWLLVVHRIATSIPMHGTKALPINHRMGILRRERQTSRSCPSATQDLKTPFARHSDVTDVGTRSALSVSLNLALSCIVILNDIRLLAVEYTRS